MKPNKIYYPEKAIDYGILSDASRTLNSLLGDTSGRTVSRRTAQGFKDSFDLNISDNDAEHIVHGGMVTSALLLRSESQGARILGGFLALGLGVCYQNGK